VPPLSSTIIDLTDNHQVGKSYFPAGDTASGAQGDPMNGLDCHPDVAEPQDQVTHISVFLDGQQIAFPGQVGIVKLASGSSCVYATHTHNSSGKVHVKGDAGVTYTLGQLFSIWGQSLDPTNFAGISAGKDVQVFITDSGMVSAATGDWHDIAMNSHREITVQIGSAITEIPNYTWNGN
jgi:hypothetical protein